MKNALIRFAYWLLKKMGVMFPRPEEVKITITAEDHASPVIAAITEKAAQMRAHLDAAEKSAEKINAMTGSAKPSAEEAVSAKTVYPETVDCKACGCMIKKNNAVSGAPRIANDGILSWCEASGDNTLPLNERIVRDSYCKACAPKLKAEKKTKRGA